MKSQASSSASPSLVVKRILGWSEVDVVEAGRLGLELDLRRPSPAAA